MSVFLALDLDEPVRAEVTHLVETHRATVDASWLRADKHHLTLVFLGNPTADQVDGFAPRFEAVARAHRPFSLRLSGAGTFVTARAPAVLWLGVDGELAALRALQRDAAEGLGEPREYVPHVTLGRAHTPGAFDALAHTLASFGTRTFDVTRLSLFESTHHQYRVLRTFSLTAA